MIRLILTLCSCRFTLTSTLATKAVVLVVRKWGSGISSTAAAAAVDGADGCDDGDDDDDGAGAGARIEIAPRWKRILNVTPAAHPSRSGLDWRWQG